jgi:hypothetical protein
LPFEDLNYEYFDIFAVEDIQETMTNFRASDNPGVIFLDGVSCIIMGASQRVGLGEQITSLKEKGWCIIVTNLIQGKL